MGINFNSQCCVVIRCPVCSGSIHKLMEKGQLLICSWHGAECKLSLLIYVLCSVCQTLCYGGYPPTPRTEVCPVFILPRTESTSSDFSFVQKAKHRQRRFSKYTKCFPLQSVIFKKPHGEVYYASRLWDFLLNGCHPPIIHSRMCLKNQALIGLAMGSRGKYPSCPPCSHPQGSCWETMLLRDHTMKSFRFPWLAQWSLLWTEKKRYLWHGHHLSAEKLRGGREGTREEVREWGREKN